MIGNFQRFHIWQTLQPARGSKNGNTGEYQHILSSLFTSNTLFLRTSMIANARLI